MKNRKEHKRNRRKKRRSTVTTSTATSWVHSIASTLKVEAKAEAVGRPRVVAKAIEEQLVELHEGQQQTG